MGAKPLNNILDTITLGLTGPNAAEQAKKAKKEQEALIKSQADNAAALEKKMLETPKMIGPDNFMADKSSKLAKLRLGMSSTITGAGMKVPSLMPAPVAAKQKLGI